MGSQVAYTWLKDIWLPVAALIWGILAYWRQTRRRLSIRQVGSSITDRVTTFGDIQTYFSLEIAISNDSPHANIVVAHYDLELPWNEPELEPLDDPADLDPAQLYYTKPGTSIHIKRDNVLNHRRYQHRKLAPGEAFRGFFLAKGTKVVPNNLIPNEELGCIEVRFVVYDTSGKKYKSELMHLHPEFLPLG